ncbi:anaerobic selenocysteine-containing dehydrogenase [Stella humosa]|uniref:Anaerobic selenocysteine-containing dehydrogenase n=1 Tax=Stella humosa TaxID=94 RepID=A0A3N1MAH1_9PROT|nr:molybdopterin-dependent oxidoreductase [Stella humosa]ROP99749.1 anaerobic selenocysteine-containing dehydrogenase [Stella humosa]BBK31024.1 molybdopterin oxidoreductase [Stella humosa]
MAAKDSIRTTCPRDCYDGCGIVVQRRDGRIARVLGDPDHPVSRGGLCGKCAIAYNGAWLDENRRLLRPLRRTGAKGSGAFEPVSWETALADIAGRLTAIADGPGGEAVVHAHYTGTCSIVATGFPNRFFNRLGATEVEPDTVCNNAGYVALEYVYGTAVKGFDPRTAKDASAILVWGCNPSASAPHAHRYWLPEAPGKKIVVDPVRHDTARAADLHLQPFPGSDAALAFALMHVLRREGRVDTGFLEAHALGWGELSPLLDPCTPEWGEANTGVPAADIVEAARLYGAGPSLLWIGQGLQRQPQGGNIVRAVSLLPAVTGNIGKPGAGVYYLNGKGATRGMELGSVSAAHLRRGPARSIGHMGLAGHLADPARSSAFFCWNMNVAASAPNQTALLAALAREDLFTVVVDPFMTDTARLADYVLPAASFLEFDDLAGSYFHISLGAQVKAAEPMGESLPNSEIFRRLAGAMGYDEPELQESDRAIIDRQLALALPGTSFEDLAAVGTMPVGAEAAIFFADHQFPTPSGRIEIASAAAELAGHGRLPSPMADARPAAGRLRLLTPASRWLMNSSYGNDAGIAGKLGAAQVILHPDDAEARGLVAGDQVTLRNATGSLSLRLAVAEIVPPGVALSDKSRWLDGGANVNVLNPGLESDMGRSTALHGVEVEVSKAA